MKAETQAGLHRVQRVFRCCTRSNRGTAGGKASPNVYAGEDVRRGIQTRLGAKTCERKEVEVYLFQLC